MRTTRLILICVVCVIGCIPPAESDAKPPKIRLEPLVRGLDRPVYLTHDGTDRLFIVEQPGRIRLFVGGRLQQRSYLDIVKKVYAVGECGLLSVAFHPNFAENGYLYINYTTRQPRLVTIVSELKADPKAPHVDPATERVVLKIEQPYANHNGGQLKFGPDGYLYIGMGDGGSAADPHNHAQNPASLLGKMLRIDVNRRDPYGIPDDNPFVARRDYRPEIWATGLRNPWRFSFDRVTHDLWAADVGQYLWEEIDIITRGGNYGWRYREGKHDFRPQRDHPPLIDPIKEYGRALGVSITGGYVYRGKSIPALRGWYIYADYGSGRVWGLKYEKGRISGDAELLRIRGQPASFGEDLAGELYLCDHGGGVYRIVSGDR